MCANSEGSGETARMRRLALAFAGRICDKYHNTCIMSWLVYFWLYISMCIYVTGFIAESNLHHSISLQFEDDEHADEHADAQARLSLRWSHM